MLTAAKLILHSHNKASEMGCLASTGSYAQFPENLLIQLAYRC